MKYFMEKMKYFIEKMKYYGQDEYFMNHMDQIYKGIRSPTTLTIFKQTQDFKDPIQIAL